YSVAPSLSRLKCSLTCALPPLTNSVEACQVWWYVTQAAVSRYESIRGPFELRIEVCSPPLAGDVVDYLKQLLDGLISALHSQPVPNCEAVRRLAKKMGKDEDEIKRRLTNPTAPIFGPCNLLRPHKDGENSVKWYPADHLCIRCTILTREAT